MKKATKALEAAQNKMLPEGMELDKFEEERKKEIEVFMNIMMSFYNPHIIGTRRPNSQVQARHGVYHSVP
jgi:hypothetical protein